MCFYPGMMLSNICELHYSCSYSYAKLLIFKAAPTDYEKDYMVYTLIEQSLYMYVCDRICKKEDFATVMTIMCSYTMSFYTTIGQPCTCKPT